MKEKLLIIGASGHGKVVVDTAKQMKRWDSIEFIDDDTNLIESMGVKVIGKTSEIIKYIHSHDIFVAIGNNKIREKIIANLIDKGATVPTLIHPSAVINQHVDIDIGTAVMAGAVINSDTKIGKGCIVNTGSTIDHDNVLEDFVHVSPGAHVAGSVHIGSRTWIGIGGVISNNIEITNDCIIGAGTVVIESITDPGVYVGVPARRV